jgi:hypothetical protein
MFRCVFLCCLLCLVCLLAIAVGTAVALELTPAKEIFGFDEDVVVAAYNDTQGKITFGSSAPFVARNLNTGFVLPLVGLTIVIASPTSSPPKPLNRRSRRSSLLTLAADARVRALPPAPRMGQTVPARRRPFSAGAHPVWSFPPSASCSGSCR